MTMTQTVIGVGEKIAWPDVVTSAAISLLVGRTRRRLSGAPNDADRRFAQGMLPYPIAVHIAEANAQHYEIPAEFFVLVLGPQRKYSCCLYNDGTETLAAAEERALRETASHAALADGQRILELGCGWGSLSLRMARRYPAARITSVSNSHSQRQYITGRVGAEGLTNLDVITADMNDFEPIGRFDPSSPSRCSSTWPTGNRCCGACVIAWKQTAACSCTCSAVSARLTDFRRTTKPIGLRNTTSRAASCRAAGSFGSFPKASPSRPSGIGTAFITHVRRRIGCENFDRNSDAMPAPLKALTAPTPGFGSAAGGCSSWRRQDCSVTPQARNGA